VTPTVFARLAAGAFVLSIAADAQVPSRIDFVRDVQPIFRDHCVSCHGPELQMGGVRLDRRRDAFLGGSQTVIGPRNAEGSRLFHRVAGTALGMQMPPGDSLTDEQIEIIRQWIDEGAEWPDGASGDVAVPPTDSQAAELIAALRVADAAAIDRLVRPGAPVLAARGPDGATPLMAAALYGDATLVRRLLAAGADPDARDVAGATALMWAAGNAKSMRALLDAGADVNARSDERRTPLAIASGIAGATSSVQLLLEYGADPTVSRADDVSPLMEAARVNNSAAFQLLLEYGADPAVVDDESATVVRSNCGRCGGLIDIGGPLPKLPPDSRAAATAPRYDPGRLGRPTAIGPIDATPAAIRTAVQRSLPLLQDVGVSFVQQTGCVSCHHNSLVSMAVAAARANGFTVNETAARAQTTMTARFLETWRARTIQNMSLAGGADAVSYLLVGLGADEYAPDAITDAQAIWLVRRQAADGHWPVHQIRPPIESSDIEVTAVSMRALQRFAPPSRRAEFDRAVVRAREWLMQAEAEDTEDLAFRLLGLTWAGSSRNAIETAARDLLAAQQRDGGWAQREGMSSDAYATGEALAALSHSDTVRLKPAAHRNGIAFLLRTQVEDGSWPLESRSVPIQPYFETGFPYGVSQWIAVAATAWATTALALAR
jgi:mono/diheme cytochrome c family protein